MLLGLDIGTGSIKVVVYDPDLGKIVASSSRPTPVTHPQPGWSEHDPELLWQTAMECIREAAAGKNISALAISSMAETGVLLDKNFKTLYPIIAWYDRRSEQQASWIEEQVSAEEIFLITGQRASPSFGLTKILWLKENLPDIFSKATNWLPVPSYFYWRFTGQMVLDYTIASRTLAFDQQNLNWSNMILRISGIPNSLFPPVFPSGSSVGKVNLKSATDSGLSHNTLCFLGGHDHLCAALATGAYSTGAVTDSTGSSNALMMVLPAFLNQSGLAKKGFACYPHVVRNSFVLKGGLKAAGSAIEWLVRLVSKNERESTYSLLEHDALIGIGNQIGPIWLPHLIGSGTPEGDRFSRAALIGLQYEHSISDLFRGLLESLAFWTRHNLDEMSLSSGLTYRNVVLTGGVTRINLLSQLKADVINRPVYLPEIPETAATGAALLAGLGLGIFSSPDDAVGSLQYKINCIYPDEKRTFWYDHLFREAYLPLYSSLLPINQVLNNIQKNP